MTDMVGDWIYFLGYCIEMAYRRSRHRRHHKSRKASRAGSRKVAHKSMRRGGKRHMRKSRKTGGGMNRLGQTGLHMPNIPTSGNTTHIHKDTSPPYRLPTQADF